MKVTLAINLQVMVENLKVTLAVNLKVTLAVNLKVTLAVNLTGTKLELYEMGGGKLEGCHSDYCINLL